MLSNLFGTAGRTQINLGAVGCNSKQRLKFCERYKLGLHVCNTGAVDEAFPLGNIIAPHDDNPKTIGRLLTMMLREVINVEI